MSINKKHLIDCDVDPFVPDDWKVYKEDQLEGRVRGKVDPQNIMLCEIDNTLQKDLCTLEEKPVLTANVLDYLLANPNLIPDEWQKKHVFFFGTIYNSEGYLAVRCLYQFDEGEWIWGHDWLDRSWRKEHAALLAS